MADVALVGSGNIGVRHLQAIMACGLDGTIHVVDPAERALQQARSVARAANSPLSIAFHRDAEELPEALDLLVVATSAQERRTVLERVLERVSVDKVVLEKFLFTRLDDYTAIGERFASSGIQAWVNCPRRTWPSYKRLRDEVNGQGPLTMRITGSQWGLASNAVHGLDTLCFLTGKRIIHVDAEHVVPEIKTAKRGGYVEVFGRLDGITDDGSDIHLTCYERGNLPRLTEIVSHTFRVLIDEKGGKVVRFDQARDFTTEAFEFVNVSGMGSVYQGLIERGTCDLPTYDESSDQHTKVIAALGARLGIDVTRGEPCLVT